MEFIETYTQLTADVSIAAAEQKLHEEAAALRDCGTVGLRQQLASTDITSVGFFHIDPAKGDLEIHYRPINMTDWILVETVAMAKYFASIKGKTGSAVRSFNSNRMYKNAKEFARPHEFLAAYRIPKITPPRCVTVGRKNTKFPFSLVCLMLPKQMCAYNTPQSCTYNTPFRSFTAMEYLKLVSLRQVDAVTCSNYMTTLETIQRAFKELRERQEMAIAFAATL